MRVLITGGGGFIGAWIARRLLAKGDQVRILEAKSDRSIVREIIGAQADTLDWQIGDVSDRRAVANAAEACDTIFHMAAILTPAPTIPLTSLRDGFTATVAHYRRRA